MDQKYSGKGPGVVATPEAETRRTVVYSQSGQNVTRPYGV
jgi:hypothetical protein